MSVSRSHWQWASNWRRHDFVLKRNLYIWQCFIVVIYCQRLMFNCTCKDGPKLLTTLRPIIHTSRHNFSHGGLKSIYPTTICGMSGNIMNKNNAKYHRCLVYKRWMWWKTFHYYTTRKCIVYSCYSDSWDNAKWWNCTPGIQFDSKKYYSFRFRSIWQWTAKNTQLQTNIQQC